MDRKASSSFAIQDLLGLREKTPLKLSDSDPAQDGTRDPLLARKKPRRKRRRQAADSVGREGNSSESEGEIHHDLSSSESNTRRSQPAKRLRTAFTVTQLRALEHFFRMCPYPDNHAREQMARTTGIEETKIQVWFQNRRARYRKRERPTLMEQNNCLQLPAHLYYYGSPAATPGSPPMLQSPPSHYFPLPLFPYYPHLPFLPPLDYIAACHKLTGRHERCKLN